MINQVSSHLSRLWAAVVRTEKSPVDIAPGLSLVHKDHVRGLCRLASIRAPLLASESTTLEANSSLTTAPIEK